MIDRESVLRELKGLPPEKIQEVLDLVRFLRIRAKSDDQVSLEFREGVARARTISAERGITEEEIAEEIRHSRARQ